MIKINADSKIYILCPADIVTGGTELAHQLVDCLIKKGKSAFIVYVKDNHYAVSEVPKTFRKYSIKMSERPVDKSENVLVCPETEFTFVHTLKKIQCMFWWMSVDNFYLDSTLYNQLRFFGFYITLRNVYARFIRHQQLIGTSRLGKLKKIKNEYLHLYQSEYARNFLLSKNITKLMPLSDYINSEFIKNSFSQLSIKENIILYYPRKGLNVTNKIIAQMPEYKFIPLSGLNRIDLQKHFSKAKLYIDFGNHPGKDRMPREAAMNYCCIVTGKDGAAKHFEDIPIADKYKFEKNEITSIVSTIKDILDNYQTHIDAFTHYREKIMKEKEVFENEVDTIFFH